MSNQKRKICDQYVTHKQHARYGTYRYFVVEAINYSTTLWHCHRTTLSVAVWHCHSTTLSVVLWHCHRSSLSVASNPPPQDVGAHSSPVSTRIVAYMFFICRDEKWRRWIFTIFKSSMTFVNTVIIRDRLLNDWNDRPLLLHVVENRNENNCSFCNS